MKANSDEHNHVFSVEVWDEARFLRGEEEWCELLTYSDSDNLFLTWKWMSLWWELWKKPESRLFIVTVYSGTRLVGLAPFYIEPTTYLRGLLKLNRLQFLGGRWNGLTGMRGEYMDIIVHREFQGEAVAAILQAISKDQSWTEICLADLNTDSTNYHAIHDWLLHQKFHGRTEAEGDTYRINCQGSFDDYLSALGKNSRLKLYNRRKLLEQKGVVEIKNYDTCQSDELNELFEVMNAFHQNRWNGVAISAEDRKHLLILCDQGGSISLSHSSVLLLNGMPLSAILDITYGGCVYNIQLGFVEDFDKKIALGTLHIGYSIEALFNDPEIKFFDLLEGEGKNSNYKAHIAKPATRLATTRWMRSWLLKAVFGFYDKFLRN